MAEIRKTKRKPLLGAVLAAGLSVCCSGAPAHQFIDAATAGDRHSSARRKHDGGEGTLVMPDGCRVPITAGKPTQVRYCRDAVHNRGVFHASDGSLPLVDLSGETNRHAIVVAGTETVYQGHPTTVLSGDGKRVFCVWTLNHGYAFSSRSN